MINQGNLMFGYFWSPLDQPSLFKELGDLDSINLKVESVAFSKLTPPTHFLTNDFTWIFQEIVNTYGTPTFGEINPAVFANVSFPFLFGVMFGDVGHGLMLMIAGGLMCMFQDKLSEDVAKLRYITLMMGWFSFYIGLIYNDCMSIPLTVFGKSCFEGSKQICVYPFGFDPVWLEAENDIPYYNSFKMKISVIIGIAQMTLGIFLKGLNAVHFKKPLDLYHEVVP